MQEKQRVYIASDHAGFCLKEVVVDFLKKGNVVVEVVNLGPYNDNPVDYPDYAVDVSEKVSQSMESKGILICGSGIGVSIVANKYPNIRAALCTSVQLAKLSRRHNNANILCLGARILKEKNALMIVEAWLKTGFEGGRHQHRIAKINEIRRC